MEHLINSKHAKIGKWLLTGNIGSSSKFMAAIALGASVNDLNDSKPRYPHDGGDFDRCLKLVQAVPEVKDSFPEIAKSSKEWAGIIENWNMLENTYKENLEKTTAEGAVYTLYDLLLKVTRPEEFARQQKQKEDAEIAKLQAEKSKPTHSPLGVLLKPDPHKDKELMDKLIDEAAREIAEELISLGAITPSDTKGFVDGFKANPWLTQENGMVIFKELDFDLSTSDALEIAEALDSYSSCFDDAYNKFLNKWIVENNVQPPLPLGARVSFKHGGKMLNGVIEEISAYSNYPMHYLIKVDGKDGNPVIFWDDDSLIALRDDQI